MPLLFLLLAPFAFAFQTGSSFSNPCHESITLRAFFDINNQQSLVPGGFVSSEVVETNPKWLQVAESLESDVEYEFSNDLDRFFAINLFIGVPYPDQANFAITDF